MATSVGEIEATLRLRDEMTQELKRLKVTIDSSADDIRDAFDRAADGIKVFDNTSQAAMASAASAYKQGAQAVADFIADAEGLTRISTQTVDVSQAAEGASAEWSKFEAAVNAAMASATASTDRYEAALRDLQGVDVINQANAYAEALIAVGGASSLTADEQEKVNGILVAALDKYRALGQEAPSYIKHLADATAKASPPTSLLSDLIDGLGKNILATAAGFFTAQAVLAGISKAFNVMVGFVQDSVNAFAEAEASSRKLSAAIDAQGAAVPNLKAKYNDMAKAFERTTIYSDDLITEMQALLVLVGNVMPQDMNTALKASTDLASGLGIDLRTATMMVGKAFAGETGTLKRYGIVIDEARLKTEGATAVMDVIQKKFGGQAQQQVLTYAGGIAQLSNAWNNLQESVGEVIAKQPALIMMMEAITQALRRGTTAANTLFVALMQVAGLSPATYAALLKGLGMITPTVDEAKEALKGLRASLEGVGATRTKTPTEIDAGRKQAAEDQLAAMRALDAAVAQLTETERGWIKAGQEHGQNAEQMQTWVGKSAAIIQQYINTLKDGESAAKKFGAAQDALSGQAAIKAASEMARALGGV
ncbi:MAG TPA: hypothetical protein VFN64_11540, partial [Burkholderiaceae bacterium]|nr:hypothetical protein [Burkholderiaceae bacterium]